VTGAILVPVSARPRWLVAGFTPIRVARRCFFETEGESTSGTSARIIGTCTSPKGRFSGLSDEAARTAVRRGSPTLERARLPVSRYRPVHPLMVRWA